MQAEVQNTISNYETATLEDVVSLNIFARIRKLTDWFINIIILFLNVFFKAWVEIAPSVPSLPQFFIISAL